LCVGCVRFLRAIGEERPLDEQYACALAVASKLTNHQTRQRALVVTKASKKEGTQARIFAHATRSEENIGISNKWLFGISRGLT
jgi:hypothetical protein